MDLIRVVPLVVRHQVTHPVIVHVQVARAAPRVCGTYVHALHVEGAVKEVFPAVADVRDLNHGIHNSNKKRHSQIVAERHHPVSIGGERIHILISLESEELKVRGLGRGDEKRDQQHQQARHDDHIHT